MTGQFELKDKGKLLGGRGLRWTLRIPKFWVGEGKQKDNRRETQTWGRSC